MLLSVLLSLVVPVALFVVVECLGTVVKPKPKVRETTDPVHVSVYLTVQCGPRRHLFLVPPSIWYPGV